MPAILAALGAILINLLRVWAASIIARVFVAFGVALAVHNFVLPDLYAFIAERFQSLPAFVHESAAASGIDIFITMVVSALVLKAASRVFLGRWGSD
jgi:hypothetical protein